MRLKGQASELMEILILVIGVSVLLMISYFLFTSRTPRISDILVESYKYSKITDVANEFYYTKIFGTEKTLSQLLGDRIAAGKNPVIYGKDWGNIDVDNQTFKFFSSYFGSNWRLQIFPPQVLSVGIIVDTSSSTLNSSLSIIKARLPSILEELRTSGKEIFVNFYLLGGESYVKCSDFENMTYTSCTILSVDQCNLIGQESEDWGNSLACVIEFYKPDAIILISDEPSGGCEPCLNTYAPNPGPVAELTLQNGTYAAKSSSTRVFPLAGIFPCFMACPQNPIYCTNCDKCCVENTKTHFKFLAEETGGKYYDLNGSLDAGEIVKLILESIPLKEIDLGYKIPKDISRVQTFELLIPVPTVRNQVVKGNLYVW
jgi:hypothetical protein